jgi:chromate transporter
MDENIYWQLILVFLPLSLVAVGGGQSVVAGIDAQVVQLHHWVSQREFVDLFAISRAAPGPGSLLATLIGWRVGGLGGAIVSSLAFFVPTSLLAYGVGHAWTRYEGNIWHGAIQRGLAPIAAGLILASAFAVLRSSSGSISIWATALVCGAIFTVLPKLNPLPVLLAAGIAQLALRQIG